MSLLADHRVVQFIGNGKIKDIDSGKDFLEWIYRTYKMGKDLGLMVLVKKEDKSLIGHAGLVPQSIEGEEEIEIGYWISPEHWGKGYATEAARALLEYGSHQLNLKRFMAFIQPGNIASQKVAVKIGVQLEKKIELGGKEVHMYSILA